MADAELRPGRPRAAGPDVATARCHDGGRRIGWQTIETRIAAFFEARDVVERGEEQEFVVRASLVDLASAAVELASGMLTPTVQRQVTPKPHPAPCACGCPGVAQDGSRFATPDCRERLAAQHRIARGGQRRTHELQDRAWLRQRFVVDGATVRELADELCVTTEGVRVALRRTGLWQHGGHRDGAEQQIAA